MESPVKGFALSYSPGVGTGPYGGVAADVIGDGKVDLIYANAGDNTLSVLINGPHVQATDQHTT